MSGNMQVIECPDCGDISNHWIHPESTEYIRCKNCGALIKTKKEFDYDTLYKKALNEFNDIISGKGRKKK